MTEEFIWGRSRNRKSKYVHLYANGKACCGQGPRMDLQNENWDPDGSVQMEDGRTLKTCPHCREYYQWIKRGFHKTPSSPKPS